MILSFYKKGRKMTKKYNLNKILLFSIFSLILILAGIGLNSFAVALADSANSLPAETVKVLSRENENISLSPNATTMLPTGDTVYSYKWEECSKINISFTNENITSGNVSLRIELLKGYVNSELDYSSDDRIYIENALGGRVSGSTFSYNFDIDNGVVDSTGVVSTTIKGWGIYRFTIKIASVGQEFTSALYNIAPKTDLVKPSFIITTKGSTSSMHDDYICSITNQGDYKFADTSKLIWHAEGVSVEGKSYCLTYADKNETGANFDDYLYTSIERTGLSFVFNAHKGEKYINGNWNIYCVYKPDEFNSLESDKINIKNGVNFNLTIFVISLISAIVVITAIFVLCQFVKSKKEKVW